MPLSNRLVGLFVVIAFLAAAVPAAAITPRASDMGRVADALRDADGAQPFFWERSVRSDYVLAARDTVDVEDHGGYTGEYIFGMTKGVMRSTLTPALKPVVLLLTVPLDLVFLPFAAIGGFFR